MTTLRETGLHLSRMREKQPLVHSITNYVSMDVAANVLLALGASPAMLHAEEEVEEFVGLSDALVINIGTVSPPWAAAMHRAAAKARSLERPIVLDPVGVGATRYRTELAVQLVRGGIDVVRGNASEILALAGVAAGPTRGADASHAVSEAVGAANTLATQARCVVVVTGATDHVTDGNRSLEVVGGSPRMAQVTALGCALSASVGAFLGSRPAETPALDATAHALACFAAAGARAHPRSEGPGTFRSLFIDALSALDTQALQEHAEIRT